MYTPDAATRARRIAARNVSATLMHYMHKVWRDLFSEEGAAEHIETETGLLQYLGVDNIPYQSRLVAAA